MQRPWHLRPASALAIVWYVAGIADYLLTQLRVPAYVGLFTPEIVAWFAALPARVDASWAVAVWAGLAGALMMTAGLRRAALMLAISAASMVFLAIWLVVLADPPLRAVAGPAGDVVMLGSAAVSVLIWLYARAMHARAALP